ncbi:MAG: hypothetical protein Q4D02_07295 [Clostridia bacterium]|nr:hypothetical protein [Clostridia bacterium]
MAKEFLIDEVLLRNLMSGKAEAIEEVKGILGERYEYIIEKEIVTKAYSKNEEAIQKIKSMFGTSERPFIFFLYHLYMENEDVFLRPNGEENERCIRRILNKYRRMRKYLTREEVKEMLEKNNLVENNSLYNSRAYTKRQWVSQYIKERYYDRHVIEVVAKILKYAEEEGVYKDDIIKFIELGSFGIDTYFVFKFFGELEKKVIIMYFNEDRLFENVFDIAAYIVKTNYSCETDLSKLPLEKLGFNTRLYNLLLESNVRSIGNLQDIIRNDQLLRLEGVGIVNAKTIIDTLWSFYFKSWDL